MGALVEIRSLSKVYERGRQRIEVLHHIDMDVQGGEFVALMGPSGSGKTTLLNLIGGLDSPTEGSLTVAGERIEPCRLFSYDPAGGGFRDLGILAVDRSPYYSWRGYQFDSMATAQDGTVYIGESERRSHLFLYLP